MTAQLSPPPVFRAWDNLGFPLVGGKLFTYAAGTTTPQATYTDSTQTTQNTNPIVLNFRGEAFVWLNPLLSYKFVLQDFFGNLIWTVDNIQGGINVNSNITPSQTNTFTLGTPTFTWANAYFGPNGAPVFDPVSGNIGYYARTAAEIAAGVTPVNYVYAPGDVRRYGAKLDGSTDDHVAFQAADSQCANGGAVIYVALTSGSLATSIGLTVSYLSSVRFDPGAFILYTGSSDITALTIGDATHVAQWRKYENLGVQRQTQSTWASTANIGIQFGNLSNCFIQINFSRNFTIGVKTLPSGGNGFQYNDVFLGQINNNKYGLVISNQTAGYTNQNSWYSGRFNVNSGVNSTTSRYAVRITSDDATTTDNNNVFWKPDFELNVADISGGAEAIPILLEYAQENHFRELRDENNSKTGSIGILFRTSNASTENSFEIGYSDYIGYPAYQDNSSAPVSYVVTARDRVFDHPTRVLFNSGPMGELACFYDGGTSLHVPNIGHANIGNSGPNIASSNNVTIQTGALPKYLQYATGGNLYPSVFVDTSIQKSFLVVKDVLSGFGGRVAINCYDASGTLITTASSVKGSVFNPFGTTTSGNFGGCFQTGSDTTADTFFTVTAAVQYVRVVIPAFDAALKIRAFQIFAVNSENFASVWPGYEQVVPGANIGTAAPTSGTWVQGRWVYNATPSAAGTVAWICTTGGTPGTWTGLTIP
jgi:hypothetical protein